MKDGVRVELTKPCVKQMGFWWKKKKKKTRTAIVSERCACIDASDLIEGKKQKEIERKL